MAYETKKMAPRDPEDGEGGSGYSGDGGPATDARLSNPSDVARDEKGNLYIADTGNHCIRKINPSGIITTVAGTGTSGYSGDKGSAAEAELDSPRGISVDNEGSLNIADSGNHCIRKVDPNGVITTVVGTGERGYNQKAEPAAQARLNDPESVVVDDKGKMYIADSGNARICMGDPTPMTLKWNVEQGNILFADSKGSGYLMQRWSGRHKKTIDLATGNTIYEFQYNRDDKLTTINDKFGNTIKIQRQGNSAPSAIISPEGQKTLLKSDSRNHLTGITLPDGSSYSFQYTQYGLLTRKVDPEIHQYDYAYSPSGHLTDTYDEHGGHWSFRMSSSASGQKTYRVISGEDNLREYVDRTYSTGKYASDVKGFDGGVTKYNRSADGFSAHKSTSCGMELDFEYGIDPRYQHYVMKSSTLRTPSGLNKHTSLEKDYQDTTGWEAYDRIVTNATVNGRTTTVVQDILDSQKTVSSPEGRTTTSTYDPETLVTTSTHTPGLEPTDYYYYNDGKLESIVTGTRETAFTYDANGYLDTVTGPGGRTTYFTNDRAGRVTSVERPDSTTLDFVYDRNGNMTVLTNPSDVDHEFDYNAVDLKSAYLTPISGSYSYVYDKDRRLIQKNFPSGRSIYLDYTNPSDPQDKSRLWQIQTPEGNIDYTYLCANKVASVSRGPESITYGYDGKLVTSETLSGTLNQSLAYTYNNDFKPESFTYAGATRFYTYDKDGLLTGAGEFTISRYNNPGTNETGLPYSVADTSLNLERTFNTHGETTGEDTNVGGYDIYSWRVTNRYPDGKIRTKTETIGGDTDTFEYTYDQMGRLATVTRNRTLVEEYTYDERPYGTRTYQVNTRRDISGCSLDYDDEDRLLSAGNADYQYDRDGFLESKITSEGTTSYNYSSRGELLSVNLPDGTIIEYINDPLGRRIAKKVDGEITKKYLWQGRTRLLAVYDRADNLLMRFQYADSRMPVAVEKEGTTYYLACNQVGSLRAVADATGNVVKEITYDSFGYILNDTNPDFEIPLGFAGGLHDRDTGLVRFGWRDYDPDTGRWTAKDPILFAGGDTDLYGYCLKDSVNFVDSEGQFINLAAAGVGAAFGSGIGAVNAIFKGESVLEGAITGAGVGALAGVSFGSSVLLNAAIGGGIGATTDIIGQMRSNPCGNIDTLSVGISALAGTVGGGGASAMIKGGATAADAALISTAGAGGVSTGLNATANYGNPSINY